MGEVWQSYGIWIALALIAVYLIAGAGGHGGGMGCGGRGSHHHRRGDRRPAGRAAEDEWDEATVGRSRNRQPHH